MPVVLAANRDEFLHRPSAGPGMLDAGLGIVGGRDLQAGGTWLAVSASGFFVALTNQRDHGPASDALASRGQVVLEVARAGVRGGPTAARAWLQAAEPGGTRPYNLLFGNRSEVHLARVQDRLTLSVVGPGVHVLPNGALNSDAFPKVARIQQQLAGVPRSWPSMQAALWAVLADDQVPAEFPDDPGSPFPPDVQAALHAVWVRLPMYGTRSSSLVAMPDRGAIHYAFIDGPPSGTPTDQSHLLALSHAATGTGKR